MRYVLLFLILMLTGIGQSISETRGSKDEARQNIAESQLEERDGLQYQISSSAPYTGKVTGRFYNGQIRSETNYRKGTKDGKSTTWHENGRIRLEASYKGGKRDGQWIKRDKKGQIQFQRFYREGRRVN